MYSSVSTKSRSRDSKKTLYIDTRSYKLVIQHYHVVGLYSRFYFFGADLKSSVFIPTHLLYGKHSDSRGPSNASLRKEKVHLVIGGVPKL